MSETAKGLIISRREGEQIVINGGELKITIIELNRKKVRLVFEANKEILIQRAELLQENILAKVTE